MEQVGNEHIKEPAVVEIVKFFQEHLPKSARHEEPYTIYRIPKPLHQANDKGFEPQLLSIGPFHHGKEGLKPMEEKKLQYLRAILSRNPMVELKDYVEEIKKLKVKAKSCYSESIGDDFEFEKMMLLDGCFLVEMFLRIPENKEPLWLGHFVTHDMLLLENQIPAFILERIFSLVMRRQEPGSSIKDLALPCFEVFHSRMLNKKAKAKKSYHHLLDFFHHHCLPHQEADPDIGEQFRQNLENRPVLTRVEEQSPPNLEVRIESTPVEKHSRPEVRRSEFRPLEEPLLPQVRMGLYTPFEGSSIVTRGEEFPPNLEVRIEVTPVEEQSLPEERRGEVTSLEEPGEKRKLFGIPSAEELKGAGITFKRKEFKKKEETPGSFLDIEFDRKGGVMKIPYLFVSDNLRFILINLVAYEQCYPSAGTYFTGYALFMDDLVNTAKDVRILRESLILENGVGSNEELAKHFNQLSTGVFCNPETTHLYKQREEINIYCTNKWNTWRANLFRDYFYSPWAAISLAGALFAVALSIFNTSLSIYSTFYA